MKTNLVGFLSFLLIAFLVCSSHSSSAHRLLQQKQGEKDQFKAKEKEIIKPGLLTDANEDFSNLMGSEECHEKDEECVERRMIAEAHLDYIYTQHHKP